MSMKKVYLDIIGKRKFFYIISAVIIIAGIIAFAIQGFNFGIDFTGGSYVQVSFYESDAEAEAAKAAEATEEEAVDEEATAEETAEAEKEVSGKEIALEDLRAVVNEYVEHTPTIQYDQTNRSYVIRTDLNDKDDVNAMLDAIESEIGSFELERNELVGPTIGNELTQKAILALAIACFLMLIYITVRFEVWFGIASIVALLHDALIVLSVFAIFQFEISSSFIAAILTVIGYSINASIVIFDRVRESMPNYKPTEKAKMINYSISLTLARSLNTTITTVLTLLALIIFGGDTTKIFVFAMLIGILAGLYSSVCLAGSVYFDLSSKFGKKKKRS